ncbi:hypothetical protein GCM10023346_13750 [Arthrobacter gyeryongensis]|uniref:Uncharacterized protein n=1 Tax=Arthrobacter gyeryongensis TaxID=1650592 RepID=A0ABP9S755_9MICC
MGMFGRRVSVVDAEVSVIEIRKLSGLGLAGLPNVAQRARVDRKTARHCGQAAQDAGLACRALIG